MPWNITYRKVQEKAKRGPTASLENEKCGYKAIKQFSHPVP
jgi:hypothetical protein